MNTPDNLAAALDAREKDLVAIPRYAGTRSRPRAGTSGAVSEEERCHLAASRPDIVPGRGTVFSLAIMMNESSNPTGHYEAALTLAKNGYIPVAMLPGRKVPAEKGWQEWMHRDVTEESIAARWQGTRNGIALLCKDLLVLDVDSADLLDMVLDRCGLKPDEAPICKTPRGGYHVHARYRRGVDLRAKIKLRGQELDLLTGPRLSILPRHTNDHGVAYEWLGEGLPPKSELPIAKIGWTRERSRRRLRAAVPPAIDEPDRERLLYRARRYLEPIEPAVSGQGGHNKTFSTACKLAKFVGYDAELLWILLQEYSARCLPPWSEEELRHKWEDALKTRP